MKPPAPLTMWAAIIRNSRVEWINWHTIRSEAREACLKDMSPAYHKKALKNVRFARVTITEKLP